MQRRFCDRAKKNIKACFAGTPLENKVAEYLNFLSVKGVLGPIEDSSDVLYVITAVAIDKERMDKMEEEAIKSFPFDKIIAEPGYAVTKQFDMAGYMKERCAVHIVTPTSARSAAGKYCPEPNKIAVFYLFAKNESEQGKVNDAIKSIFAEQKKANDALRSVNNTDLPSRCIVVDFTALPFTDERYNKFIKSKAKERYFKNIPSQQDQMNLAKKNADAVIAEWTRALVTAQLRVYSEVNKSATISGGANLRRKLAELNHEIYGCGLEEISQNDKLFAASGYKDVVAKIAMGKEAMPNNYSYLKNISTPLEQDGIWSNPEYWKTQPNHVISKMKIAVEGVIQRGFENNSMVCVTDIWKALTEPPFGLLPCTGAVFLMAFLLKEYADTNYYKQDVNNNTVSLNYTDLCELIFTVVKGLPKAKEQYIVRQKPSHPSCCKITGESFKIASDQRNSVSDIAKNLNIYLKNNLYPLWSLKSYVEVEMSGHVMADALLNLIDLLCEFVNPETFIARDKTKIAEEINELYLKNAGLADCLAKIVTSDCLRQGMEYYIAEQKPELVMIASRLKIDGNEYISLLTKKLSSDSSYLWQKGDIDRQIDNLYIDFRLIDAINGVLATPQKRYKDARDALIEKLNFIKVPDAILTEKHNELRTILQQFYVIKENAVTNKQASSTTIQGMTEEFLAFFNNQIDTFSAAVRLKVDANATGDEIEYLFGNVPAGMLFKKVDEFALSMRQALDKFRRNRKINRLFEAWRKATNTNSPSEWSKTHGIPVLCMFQNDIATAQQVFGALNRTVNLLSDEAVDKAIEFINRSNLDVLNNAALCEKEFIQYFCDEYAYVIDNAGALRDTLRKIAGNNVYEWYFKKSQCKSALREIAANRYKAKYCAKAKEKVHSLSSKQAQRYLDELIEKDPLLGIRILQGK